MPRKLVILTVLAAALLLSASVSDAKKKKQRQQIALALVHKPDYNLTAEVDGQGSLGAYYIEMQLGTPPQKHNMIFDTGSGLVHVPCYIDGYRLNRLSLPMSDLYNVNASTTKQDVGCTAPSCRAVCGPAFPSKSCSGGDCVAYACACPSNLCEYEVLYGSGGSGAEGIIFTDVAEFPGAPGALASTSLNLTFGCSLEYSNMFSSTAPYFAGMNFQSTSLFSQFVAADLIDDTLGMCLGDAGYTAASGDAAAAETEGQGLLVLGSANVTKGLISTVNTELINVSTWDNGNALFEGLWVEVSGINAAGTDIMATSSTPVAALMDSGTSLLVVPSALYATIKSTLPTALTVSGVSTATFTAVRAQGYDVITVELQEAMTPAELDASGLPSLNWSLGPPTKQVSLVLPPSHYLLPTLGKNSSQQYTFMFMESSENFLVIGNSILFNWWIQATKSTLQLSISLVNKCSDIELADPVMA